MEKMYINTLVNKIQLKNNNKNANILIHYTVQVYNKK